jgi:hypothetical protein
MPTVVRHAYILNGLSKLANQLDLHGLYSEADEIEKVMKILSKRVGLENIISVAESDE